MEKCSSQAIIGTTPGATPVAQSHTRSTPPPAGGLRRAYTRFRRLRKCSISWTNLPSRAPIFRCSPMPMASGLRESKANSATLAPGRTRRGHAPNTSSGLILAPAVLPAKRQNRNGLMGCKSHFARIRIVVRQLGGGFWSRFCWGQEERIDREPRRMADRTELQTRRVEEDGPCGRACWELSPGRSRPVGVSRVVGFQPTDPACDPTHRRRASGPA